MKVTLSFPGWNEGKVASATYEIDVAEPMEKVIARMEAKRRESQEKKFRKTSGQPSN